MADVVTYTRDALRRSAQLDYSDVRPPTVWYVPHGTKINDALVPILSYIKDGTGIKDGVHYACWAEGVAYSEGGRGFALNGFGDGGIAVVGLENLHKINLTSALLPRRQYAFTMVHELLHCFGLRDTAHHPENARHDRTMTDARVWEAFSNWKWNDTTGLLSNEVTALRGRKGLVSRPTNPLIIDDNTTRGMTNYTVVDRDPDSDQLFADIMLPGWDHGEPTGVIVHRQGNPGASALNAIRWAARTGAFSIHYYIHDNIAYKCVPTTRHAYHVKEHRIAETRGRVVYRSTSMAIVPRAFTGSTRGQYTGASKPRGDIGQIGIECVDERMNNKVVLTTTTRRTLVYLLAEIIRETARRRRQTWEDVYLPISTHSQWDPWTRPEDPGDTLWLPDLQADVIDALSGRAPWRTLGGTA
jgi:hypothetical protein